MTEKKKIRVLSVLLVICLAAAVFFGVRLHQISRQKDQLEFNTLSTVLSYTQYVLVTMEDPYQWEQGISVLLYFPLDIYQMEDQGDNQEIVDLLKALQNVPSAHPNRVQIMEELKTLRVSRDSGEMVFTILEGDAEAIAELCKHPEYVPLP